MRIRRVRVPWDPLEFLFRLGSSKVVPGSPEVVPGSSKVVPGWSRAARSGPWVGKSGPRGPEQNARGLGNTLIAEPSLRRCCVNFVYKISRAKRASDIRPTRRQAKHEQKFKYLQSISLSLASLYNLKLLSLT